MEATSTLPNELLLEILGHVSDKNTLRETALASKRFHILSNELLYSSTSLSKANVVLFLRTLSERPSFRNLVKTLQFALKPLLSSPCCEGGSGPEVGFPASTPKEEVMQFTSRLVKEARMPTSFPYLGVKLQLFSRHRVADKWADSWIAALQMGCFDAYNALVLAMVKDVEHITLGNPGIWTYATVEAALSPASSVPQRFRRCQTVSASHGFWYSGGYTPWLYLPAMKRFYGHRITPGTYAQNAESRMLPPVSQHAIIFPHVFTAPWSIPGPTPPLQTFCITVEVLSSAQYLRTIRALGLFRATLCTLEVTIERCATGFEYSDFPGAEEAEVEAEAESMASSSPSSSSVHSILSSSVPLPCWPSLASFTSLQSLKLDLVALLSQFPRRAPELPNVLPQPSLRSLDLIFYGLDYGGDAVADLERHLALLLARIHAKRDFTQLRHMRLDVQLDKYWHSTAVASFNEKFKGERGWQARYEQAGVATEIECQVYPK